MRVTELLKYGKLLDDFYSCQHYLSAHKTRMCPHFDKKKGCKGCEYATMSEACKQFRKYI